jgi:hypothetical protein
MYLPLRPAVETDQWLQRPHENPHRHLKEGLSQFRSQRWRRRRRSFLIRERAAVFGKSNV